MSLTNLFGLILKTLPSKLFERVVREIKRGVKKLVRDVVRLVRKELMGISMEVQLSTDTNFHRK